jgi:site-specific recombinase XerD
MNALTIISEPVTSLPMLPIAELERAADYAKASKAPGTIRGYQSDLALFEGWCRARGVCALPATPEAVATYLASLAESGLMVNTISRRCSAIKYGHKLANLESPTEKESVKATLAGIKRTVVLPSKRKSPFLSEHAKAMASGAPVGMRGIRDRALILFGFASAMRRSEIVALDVADLEFVEDGLRVTIRRSKTDQQNVGCVIAIPRGSPASCPVRAIRNWLSASGIESGPIFRSIRKGGRIRPERLSSKFVCDLVKTHARKLGLDAAKFGGHSLRAGWISSAARKGASIFKISDQSRHKSMDVMRGYIRDSELFQDHAGAGLL